MSLPANFEGKFEILHKLSEGGMGEVYKVRHLLLDQVQVIKVIRSQHEEDESLRLRFQREARTAIRLRHPNIAAMHDFAIGEGGTAYIVMEYIEGETLQEILVESGPLDVYLAMEVARQSLAALAFLHRQGYIHRDVSPDNLMLSRGADGHPVVKLIDLGVAKRVGGGRDLTSTGTFLGKATYSSPEQFSDREPDPRSDIYSFGVMLYQLLTGALPIHGSDFSSLVAGHLFRPPIAFEVTDPDGRVPLALRRVVMRTLEKEPDRRVASAEELARLLEPFRDPEPTVSLPYAEPPMPAETVGLGRTDAASGDRDAAVPPAVAASIQQAVIEPTRSVATGRRRPAWLPGAAIASTLLIAGALWWGLKSRSVAVAEIPIAEASYLRALEQIDAGDPGAAARLLRRALEVDPVAKADPDWVTPGHEGPYLPDFYLGLAYFELNNCVGALDAWEESERQGLVQATPQWAKLRRLRGECDALYEGAVERLQRVLDASTAVAELLAGAEGDPAFESVWRRSPELKSRVRSALDDFLDVRGRFDAARHGGFGAVVTLEPEIVDAEERLNELAQQVMDSTD